MAKTIDLEFDGYWREKNITGIPNQSGIYLVYACRYNPPQGDQNKGTVSLDKLIYIGEADNVMERIQNHEKSSEWKKQVPSGSELCFSFAPIINPDRERVEAALIFKHKPICNEEYKDDFPFDETTVNSKGQCEFITPSFTVTKTSRNL